MWLLQIIQFYKLVRVFETFSSFLSSNIFNIAFISLVILFYQGRFLSLLRVSVYNISIFKTKFVHKSDLIEKEL